VNIEKTFQALCSGPSADKSSIKKVFTMWHEQKWFPEEKMVAIMKSIADFVDAPINKNEEDKKKDKAHGREAHSNTGTGLSPNSNHKKKKTTATTTKTKKKKKKKLLLQFFSTATTT